MCPPIPPIPHGEEVEPSWCCIERPAPGHSVQWHQRFARSPNESGHNTAATEQEYVQPWETGYALVGG
jgi:hypothetical protein